MRKRNAIQKLLTPAKALLVEHLEPDLPVTAMGWPVEADGLRRLLVRPARDYPSTPLMITENGAAYPVRR